MIKINPKFIKDDEGRAFVVLSQKEFNDILKKLDDIRLYDDAIKNDTGERIPMEEAFKIIEDKRKNRQMLSDKIAYEAELVKAESIQVLRKFDLFG